MAEKLSHNTEAENAAPHDTEEKLISATLLPGSLRMDVNEIRAKIGDLNNHYVLKPDATLEQARQALDWQLSGDY